MSELPNNWTTARLVDLAKDISYGYTASSTRERIGPHLLRITDIQENEVLWSSVPYCEIDSELANKYLLKENDLVFARTGATVGKSFLITGKIPDAVFASYLIRVRCMQPEAAGYLSLYFRSQDYWRQITGFSAGIGQPNVNGSKLKELVIPLPPLAEQTRIAAKLDELLAQVDTLKARVDGIPALLKRFRQSVLAAAVSGQLTEEWREARAVSATGLDVIRNDQLAKEAILEEKPELKKKKSSIQSEIDKSYLFEIPDSWAFTTWGKISEWITYGFTRPMPKSDSGKKLLTAKDVQRFELDIADCGLTTTEAFASLSDKDRPKNGDLLITKDGSIGRSALVRTEEDFCINQSVAVCWLRSTTMNKNYLEFLSNSEFTQRFVMDKAQGMAIQHLSIIDFAKCPVPVPPMDEQDEIVRLVEQLFALAGQLENRVKAAQARIDCLTQSILTKAFRGELVPQDPNDEPASELLVRIQTQRASAPKASRARKMA